MATTTTARECDECGEDLHPGALCRTPAEILAECAPPADYAARFRAERAASIARADARRPGATPAAPTAERPAPAMPADVAAAIRALVLPASLIANSGPLDRCPCQYDPCQSCTAGRHGRCTHLRHRPNPPAPHTWITTAAGMVPNGAAGQVWTVGRPCQWVCPCPTCRRPRPQLAEVTAPGNPPAHRRATLEALTLF